MNEKKMINVHVKDDSENCYEYYLFAAQRLSNNNNFYNIEPNCILIERSLDG